MIIDKASNLKRYKNLSPLFAKAIDYLEQTDLSNLEPGKHVIDGENIFAIYMEYETKAQSDCLLESHQKYIDIQYMIEGEELIGISISNGQRAHIPYDIDKDVAFYDVAPDFTIIVPANSFAIFYPDDLHMPCIRVGEARKVKKVVVKVMVI